MITKKTRTLAEFGIANVWFCESCRLHGPATFAEDETVGSAVEKIRAAHQIAAPDCKGGTSYIRIVNLEYLKAKGLVA